MAASDGSAFDKVGNDSVQSGSLLSLLPSLLIHGAVVLVIWLGLFEEEVITPPVMLISMAPAAAPAPEEPAPQAPMVPAPDIEPEFEPEPLPATGMALPQPEPEPQPEEPVVDFTPPELPEPESFPFDPNAMRAPEPEPEDAVAIEQKKVAEKPKVPEKPKEPEKKKEKPKKKKEKPKKDTKKAAPPPVAERKPAEQPAPAAPATASTQPAKPSPSTPSKPTTSSAQTATASNEPVRVSNATFAGNCPFKYPERARRRNQTGTTVLSFTISPEGKASNIVVVESSGHRILDEYAQELVTTCSYIPAKRGNRAVPSLATQALPFTLK